MASKGKKPSKSSPTASRPPTHPLPTNPAELEHVLSLLLAPDNSAIARATTIMNDFLKQPASIPALLQQITESASVQARQMAAVLLRRKIRPLWSPTPADVKAALKAALLQRLTAEPVRVVRRSIAALVAKIAEETVPKNKWPELLDFLFQMTRSPTADHREMGMLLFRALSENIPKALQAHGGVLQGIFVAGLSDVEDRVRVEALHALDALVEMVDPESDEQVMAFSSAIPPLVQLVSSYLSSSHHEHDSEVVSTVFELFDSLTASPAPVLDPHLHLIVPMMMTVMRTTTFELNIRDQAAVFLQTVVKEKPKKITKQNHVLPLLQAVVPLLCENNDHASEEISVQHMGADLLDDVLLNIPRKHTFDWTMSTISTLFASTQPGETKGGLVVLSVAAESYCDLLAPHFDGLVKAVVSFTSHNSRYVRTAAWIALNQLSVHCSHLIAEYKQIILPALLRALAATGESHQVTEKACFALETLTDQLEKDDITPFLHELMAHMLTLLNQPGVDEDTVRSCLMTIKTLADIVKTAFVPYFPPLLPILSTLLSSSTDEHLNLRCRATECIGYLAEGVGKDVFSPQLQPVLQRVMEGMKLDYFELRESSYIFFSKLAIMLQEDFAPLLSTVLTLVLATCTSDDGIDASWKAGGFDDDLEAEDQEAEDEPRHRRNGEDEYGSELEEDLVEDEDEDVLRTVNFSVRSGALDEKVAALECMSFILTTQTTPLQPYIERCSIVLDELSGFLHPRVREATGTALFDLVQWHHRVHPIDPPVKGQLMTLPAEHAKVLKLVMEPSVSRLSEEEDRGVARSLLEIIETCIRLYGFTAVNECPKELSKQLQLLLKEKSYCQRPSDDQSDDADLSDHDVVIDSTTEVLSALALTGGPLYLPMLKEHAPLLFKFTNKDREPTSRAMAIGSLAEIAKEVGSDGMAPYLSKLVPLAIKGMEDISIEVRRNATYCVAVLITVCGQPMVQHYPAITRSVEKLMQVPSAGMYARDAVNGSSHQHRVDSKEERKEEKRLEAEERVSEEDFLGCRDNAASVIVRMLNAAATLNLINTLPLQQLFTTLFNALPLQIDQQEARAVYGGLIALYQHHAALIAPYTPQVLTAFAAVFGHPDVDASVQHDMIAFCGALMQNNRESVEQVVAAMPEKNRQQFVRFVVEQQQIGKVGGVAAGAVIGSRTITMNGNGHAH